VSKLDHMLEPEMASVQRLEVITGTGRRRRFSDAYKARIVEETLAPGAVVSEVARRHGLTPQQLFGWRRQAREAVSGEAGDGARMFVPAVLDAQAVEARRQVVPLPRNGKRPRASKADGECGIIAVEIGGITMRIGRGADAETVAVVIAALKAAS
jgi:transposase